MLSSADAVDRWDSVRDIDVGPGRGGRRCTEGSLESCPDDLTVSGVEDTLNTIIAAPADDGGSDPERDEGNDERSI